MKMLVIVALLVAVGVGLVVLGRYARTETRHILSCQPQSTSPRCHG